MDDETIGAKAKRVLFGVKRPGKMYIFPPKYNDLKVRAFQHDTPGLLTGAQPNMMDEETAYLQGLIGPRRPEHAIFNKSSEVPSAPFEARRQKVSRIVRRKAKE